MRVPPARRPHPGRDEVGTAAGARAMGLTLLLVATARGGNLPGPTLKLPAPEGTGQRVAFSPDNRTLAGAGVHRIRLWSLPSGKCLHTLDEAPNWVGTLHFTPDGKHLLVTSYGEYKEDGSCPCRLTWYDVRTGRKLRTRAFSHGLGKVALSPDGKLLATASGKVRDHFLTLRDPATGERTRRLDALSYTTLAFSPDGKLLLSGTPGGRVEVWDPATGKLVKALTVNTGQGSLEGLAVAFDGKTVVAALSNHRTVFLDLRTGTVVLEGEEGTSALGCLLIMPGGLWVALAKHNAFVVLDAYSGKREFAPRLVGRNPVRAMAVSPNGRWLAVAAGTEGHLSIWDTKLWE